jgi:hypothetical protein
METRDRDREPIDKSTQDLSGDCRQQKYRMARSIFGCLREAAMRASSPYVRTAATKKAGEKTSEAVFLLIEIA